LVQANLVEIPFKAASFDLVHSAGVLHHTPDTHKSFQAIAPLVRHLGHCFIEVYSNEFKNPVELVIHYAFRIFRVITVRLPLPLLHVLCWLLAIPSWLYIHLFNWISRRSRYVPRNLNQVKLSLFDALSPRYDWHHTTEEVVEWFEKEGFIDMRRTYENLNGIGIVGKKA
jgi:SAM-dependent methyltransferase